MRHARNEKWQEELRSKEGLVRVAKRKGQSALRRENEDYSGGTNSLESEKSGRYRD